MKKTRTVNRAVSASEEMLPEYQFDYRKARPNRFAGRVKRGSRAVVSTAIMKTETPLSPSAMAELYEQDETAWLELTAAAARNRDTADIDWDHLAEFPAVAEASKELQEKTRAKWKDLL